MEKLDAHNELVKAFRCARERIEQTHNSEITLRLLGCNTRHDVQYNLPSSGEIAAIIVGDYSSAQYTYDVLVHAKNHGLKRVSHLHPCYMALQYPLLFPYGEHGFHLGIRYADDDVNERTKRRYMTMLEFVRYHTHYRLRDANPYTCYGRLSDQIGVDVYSTVEASRLQFIADHQKDLRYETVQGVSDAIDKGLVSADSVGSRMIVPSSFTGGRRYHVMNYQDAMAICRVFGPPDLFVTFTCTTKWKEIADAIRFETGQQPCDRSDVIVRVFHMKVDEFITDIREGKTFGPVLAGVASLLMPKGRTAHSRFKIPFDMNETTMCTIRRGTMLAELIQMAEVLVGSLMIGNCSDRLCVRVSRMWEFYDPQDESKLLHADMVLIDEEVPEATSLAASLQHKRSPIMSAAGSTQRVPRISTAEHKKKVEWLVTVTVLKIDQLWWYESCRKCLKKTKPHGDAYKCSDSGCGHVGPPNPRYRLLITTGDETGETDFILFGRMAQRIVKKPLDILIADNPAGFIPDEITKLMEKVYTFNVSFTDSTIALGNVCFQVNTVVAEIGDGGQVPISPSGSQPSSISSAWAASKSTSADSVPTGGTSSQTPQSTKNYSKDKRARSPTPLSKGGSSATRQVARKILGGSPDKTGDGHDLASGIADSSLHKPAI
ncbi:putative replication protein [Zea mays]|uniref:Putative replication protein n=1 Tax=Zea mays TaxID=4577 RepID=A0A1Q0ZAJ1_MAIZE|nr:putative replication protein [Zea mays]